MRKLKKKNFSKYLGEVCKGGVLNLSAIRHLSPLLKQVSGLISVANRKEKVFLDLNIHPFKPAFLTPLPAGNSEVGKLARGCRARRGENSYESKVLPTI